MAKDKFVILRSVKINDMTIEKDRYFGSVDTKKEAEIIIELFNKDTMEIFHALKDIHIQFYITSYED
jgi:hypothetical protein